MATFEELGKYLDGLFDQNSKPKVQPRPKLSWMQCAPRVFYKYTQVEKHNADQIKLWLEQTGRFDEISIKEDGIDTEYGMLFWSDYIIQEPNDAVVFADRDEFEKQYIKN